MKLLPLSIGVSLLCLSVYAQEERTVKESNAYYDKSLEQLLNVQTQAKANVGSRSGTRDALDALVPIDVITQEQLQSSGYTELGKVLSKLIPGFNYPRPSIADGSDHAPPFTLRGLNPDQVLVLINGKRLHQSSLLHVNGTIGRGSLSVDLNTIPIRSIERVEVLRDGAAAQYGSDAIAGIINIVLKGYGSENVATLSYGVTHEGDGIMRQSDLFYSLPLPEDGFANVTLEAKDRGDTNRAGADIYNNNLIDTHFGDADTQDLMLALNVEAPKGDLVWYMHGNFDDRDSRSGAYFRNPADFRNIPSVYPNGYLPSIHPEILDAAWTGGLKGVLESGLKWDTSYTIGYNDYHFYVDNTLNRSLGVASPHAFDSGGTRYLEQIINVDLSQTIDKWQVSGGFELRKENYQIYSGDAASYALGSFSSASGAQGFPGFRPENEVDVSRYNIAAYLDNTYAFTDWLSSDVALRSEYYNDFGSTLDGKIALRAKPSEDWLVRTSASTGFRAPSLAQSHFTYTQMIEDGGNIVTYGNYAVDDPVARALGATDLKPETSQHYTIGFVYQPVSNLSISADYFITDIQDRIMATGYISGYTLSSLSAYAQSILSANNVDGAVYFANAFSTRTRGFDVRMDYKYDLDAGAKMKHTLAYNRSETRITKLNDAPSVLGVSMMDLIVDPFVKVTLEEGQPIDSIKLWNKYETKAFDWIVNINRFGSFKSTYYYTPITFRAKWTVDTELIFHIKKDFSIAIGAENIFNEMPDTWPNSQDWIVKYSQYAPFGYNGAYYYARAQWRF
ncbi:MAG: fevO-2 [Proteobacteria bacterium]|nr:fevO-2 [Pseudomonadota bacterium]